MRAGWNPTRRNRNIGTPKQGRGQDNRLVIPKSWPDDRVFWDVLNHPVAIPRIIGNCELTFLVESPRPECFYPCTIDDVASALALVPQGDLAGIELIIFRQPTRKQAQISSVWGRFLHYAAPGPYSGTAICLEAYDLSERLSWPLSLGPDSCRELARLEADGHKVGQGCRRYTIRCTPESVRNTVLFRTLFHELGHSVDWVSSVILPTLDATDDDETKRIRQQFASKPTKDKEDFAHRYAEELASRLRKSGQIPFPAKVNSASILSDGLDPAWFTTKSPTG